MMIEVKVIDLDGEHIANIRYKDIQQVRDVVLGNFFVIQNTHGSDTYCKVSKKPIVFQQVSSEWY